MIYRRPSFSLVNSVFLGKSVYNSTILLKIKYNSLQPTAFITLYTVFNTLGLCGTYDGDKNNERRMPDGNLGPGGKHPDDYLVAWR